jgi:hypothetical protein
MPNDLRGPRRDERFFYVVFTDDITVVGPRPTGQGALRPGETFMSGPWEQRANAEREATKLQALARTALRVADIWV